MPHSIENLGQAFRRLNDFTAVQRASAGITIDSVTNLQESVGIDESARATFAECVERIDGVREPHAGQILFGVIVGLLAAQLEREAS